MMRLRKLNVAAWIVMAVVEDDGTCELEQDMEQLAVDRKTRATAAGFFHMWDQIPVTGPKSFSDEWYRQLDSENEIWEFRRRGHRILCFEVAGRTVICSHLMAKSSQKTPRREIDRAVEARRRYLAASAVGEVVVEEC